VPAHLTSFWLFTRRLIDGQLTICTLYLIPYIPYTCSWRYPLTQEEHECKEMDKVFRCMKSTMDQTTHFSTFSSTHRLQDTIYVVFYGCWHISVKPRLTRAPHHSKVTLANDSLICASSAEIFVQPGATQDGDGSKASPKKNLNEVLKQAKALVALTSKDLRPTP